MYCILMDKNTISFYMPEGELSFFVYSGPGKCVVKPENTKIIETEYETEAEIRTIMWQAGFLRGFIDDAPVVIQNSQVMAFGRNSNDILFAQYILTKNPKYLDGILPEFYTICKKTADNKIMFPVVYDNNEYKILVYTAKSRIKKKLRDKYPDYKITKIHFDAPFILNDTIAI